MTSRRSAAQPAHAPAGTLRFVPMPAPEPDHLPDDASVRRLVVDAPDAYPCRRCLRDAAVGDAVILFSYNPFRGVSPYSQPGPIYLHAAPCTPDPRDLATAPAQLTRRQLTLRAYDTAHILRDAAVIDGSHVEPAAVRLLSDPAVEYLHAHNTGPGCFAVRIERATGSPSTDPAG